MNLIYNTNNTKDKRKSLRYSQTDDESTIWNILRNKNIYGYKFFRQYGIGFYIVDFYCPKLKMVIEIDGIQHFLEDNLMYDKIREDYMLTLNIITVRFSNNEIRNNIDIVVEKIKHKIKEIENFRLLNI